MARPVRWTLTGRGAACVGGPERYRPLPAALTAQWAARGANALPPLRFAPSCHQGDAGTVSSLWRSSGQAVFLFESIGGSGQDGAPFSSAPDA